MSEAFLLQNGNLNFCQFQIFPIEAAEIERKLYKKMCDTVA